MSLEKVFENQKAAGKAGKSHTVSGKGGMVSSAVKEATDAGKEILKQGGNAMDAAVTVQLALSVTEGMNTGLGGGGVMTYYDAETKKTKIFNGQGRAPGNVKPDLYYHENGELMDFHERSTSASSVAVPGVLRLLELGLDTYGSMDFAQLIEPAIQLAEDGFRVNSSMERTFENFRDRLKEEGMRIFVPDGAPYQEGDFFRQPDLAKTLKRIRDKGISDFYEGEIAEKIVDTLKEHGGVMEKEDLINYQATIEEPLWGTYKAYDFAAPGASTGGGIALAILLQLLEKLQVNQYDIHSWEKYHIIAEATRIALADQQTYVGDPAFVSIPVKGLLDDDYIEERLKWFDFNERKEKMEAGDPWRYEEGNADYKEKMDTSKHGMDTTHFSIVDQWGNIAACTTSIERVFGSGIMVNGCGFMLNNDLTDFNPEPGTASEPDGNKGPTSSKSPTIVFHDGNPFFTLGSPGASTIISSVAQVLIHVLDYHMDLGEAVKEVRIFNNPELSMEWEDGINEESMDKLKQLGYKLDRSFTKETADDRIGDVNAILINPWNGNLYGTADTPRPGRAAAVDDTLEE
jgi:gamma-glutamyltranspeptidase/glutathione hydrolase